MRLTDFEVTMTVLAAAYAALVIWDRRGRRHPDPTLDRILADPVTWAIADQATAYGHELRDQPEQRMTPFRHDCGCRLGRDVTGQPYWIPCEQHEREDGDVALWEAEMEDTQ